MSEYKRRAFMQRLYEHKLKPHHLFADLKANATHAEAGKLLAEFRSPNAPYHKFAFGNPFPRSYQALCTGAPHYPLAASFEAELAWHTHSFKVFGPEISQFLQQKAQFDNAFMIGDFSAAEYHLTYIEKRSISLWTLDARFLLLEYQKGLESNKEFLSDLNKRGLAPIPTYNRVDCVC